MFFDGFRPTYEFSVFTNRLRLKELETGRVTEQPAVECFSTKDVLVADQFRLEIELEKLLKAHTGRARLFRLPIARVAHVERALVPVEHAALRAALYNVGFSKIFLPGE